MRTTDDKCFQGKYFNMAEHIIKEIGRYEIERKIGSGGMAIVYKAFDPHLSRSVAIKLIRKDNFTLGQFKLLSERFKREARALARLNHPNIVQIYDFGEYEDMPFLVMEFLEGVTLDKVRKPISVDTAVRLIRPIVEAVDLIHEQGLLHRDIKPSNIIITKNNKVILTDFGIAKFFEKTENQNSLTATGIGIGTPEYMAPEQGLGKEIDERADLYSLSVVFYELITGRKPFIGETPLEVLTKQAIEPVPDPRQFAPELNESVKKFFDRALAKKPNERYSTMRDFLRDMDGLRLQSLSTIASKQTGFQTIPQSKSITNSKPAMITENVNQIAIEKEISATRAKSRINRWLILGLAVFMIATIAFGLRSTLLEHTMLQITTTNTLPMPNLIGTPEKALSTQFVSDGSISGIQKENAANKKTQATESTNSMGMTITEDAEQIQVQIDKTSTAETELQATETALQQYIEGTSTTIINTEIMKIQISMEKTQAVEITKLQATNSSVKKNAIAEAILEEEGQIATYQVEKTQTAATNKNLDIGESIFFGRYEQDNNLSNGPEPIEWKVIDQGSHTALLISRYGLDLKQYHTDQKPVTWETSWIRSWLNNDFYQISFSDIEKKLIHEFNVINDDTVFIGSWDKIKYTIGGENTEDKIFLLSLKEFEKFLTSDEDKELIGTSYALRDQGIYIYVSETGTSDWWLRSPGSCYVNWEGLAPGASLPWGIDTCGTTTNYAALGGSGGYLDKGGELVDEYYLIRPVIRICTGDYFNSGYYCGDDLKQVSTIVPNIDQAKPYR